MNQAAQNFDGFIDLIAERVAEVVTERMLPELRQYIADDTISEKAAIAMLDCGRATLYRWKAEGKIKPIGKMGEKTYYSRSEIIGLIKKNK